MKSGSEIDTEKQLAARAALSWVRSGMRLGLGSGSTSEWFIRQLAEALQTGAVHGIVAVPTSEKVAALATAAGIRLVTLAEAWPLDLTVDGADEIGPGLELIKGGGGALLREKVVASASRRNLIIADSSKLVGHLGTFPLPLEVAPFAAGLIQARLESWGARVALRLKPEGGRPALTDQGLMLLDCHFGPTAQPRIDDARQLQEQLAAIPGIAEHGLFLDTTSAVVIADGHDVFVHTRSGVPSPEHFSLDSLPEIG